MGPTRRFRPIGSVVLSLLLFTGLPGIAMADPPAVQPGTPSPAITGLVKNSHGDPVAGLQVSAIGTGSSNGFATTAADGTFSATVGGSDTYAVEFDDSTNWYLKGAYYTSGGGNFSVGSANRSDVTVDVGPVAIDDVVIPVGKHISGTITGPGTPGAPLEGVEVDANSLDYSTWVLTDASGRYRLAVPNGTYDLGIRQWQRFYQGPCVAYSAAADTPEPDECTVEVASGGVTGQDFQMALGRGVELETGPTGKTVAAGSSQAFTATLIGLRSAPEVTPDKGAPGVDLSNVSAIATFTMDKGGTCVAASCTPPAAGDYTVTATYATLTATAVLHATAAPATPTAAPVTPAPTPPPTSTNGSSGGEGSPWFPLFLMALTAASVTLFTVRRPLSRRR
jgi:hypothetical protein